jgi:sec-independent protein translocase protein TatA
MPFNLGMTEMLVILLILLLVFGAKRLPEMGAGMAKGIREFKGPQRCQRQHRGG